ncbi:MAG TPA: right-handed parallel beta-helix repeat-containing protein [Luteolibacter sp.]|nr:right-handed parallel beta-helix repeat-containing protein [Luteolibacter sp.]
MLLSWPLATATEFYVAPSGSDQNPGTKAKPFKTIARARDEVAKVNAGMKEDITVYLGQGTYELSAPVVFAAKDSGMNGHQVIYKALEGKGPIVSGGRKITGWQIHDKERNIYKAAVGDLEFRQIHVNGLRGIRARYPDQTNEVTLEGYLTGAAVTGAPPYQLKVKPEELAGWEKWQNLNEVEVVMVTHWKQKRARIAGIVGGTISFQAPENAARSMNHLEQPGTPHWYENAYEFLDAEGEFYLNTQTDTLYYKPRKGEDMTSVEVMVPHVDTLFHVHGASDADKAHDLVFEGITFEFSNWTTPSSRGYQVMQSATWYAIGDSHFDPSVIIPAAVQLENAGKIEIRGCKVRRAGAHGIAAVRDVVSDCTIAGNWVSDCAAGGIYLLLNDAKSTGNRIEDNTVESIGMLHSDGCGILVARTPDVSILHNEIRHVRYTGISTGWSWDDKPSAARNQEVAYNHIHHVMGLHDDGGGIYTLGRIEGMKIHHNFIHDLTRSKFAGTYGICGIYLDNGSCMKLVQDNVIENVEAAFFSGNKPNYQNTFERNFHNGPLAKIIEKTNTVRDNVAVKGADWPAEAREIMKTAGPRKR